MNAYDKITSFIVEELENGVIPWKKPYNASKFGNCINFETKKEYRGINTLTLAMASTKFKYPFFLTFKQVQKIGAQVKKGQKGFPIAFYSPFKKKDEITQKDVTIPILKGYTVFNVDQCDGIDLSKLQDVIDAGENKVNTPIESALKIVNSWKNIPKIEFVENSAYYSPTRDIINMPKFESFVSSEDYYSSLFHEMTHSTGHKDRLDRLKIGEKFGSEIYSKEELIAELGSCFLNSEAGISSSTINNNISYIQSWIKALKNDKTLILKASSQAQKAVDMILNKKVGE